MKVLVVEDSRRLGRSLRQGLRKSGFAVDVADNGDDGLALALSGGYDVVVLDLMLPGLDGMSVLERLRERDRHTPVLILSAKDRVNDRVTGLERGADDYLIKPFAFEELVARITVLARRPYDTRNPVIDLGVVRIDTARKLTSNGGGDLPLTPSEYAVLEYLALNRGRVVSKERLLDRLHDLEHTGSRNLIEVIVSNLRRKTGSGDAVIKTRRGYGYLIE